MNCAYAKQAQSVGRSCHCLPAAVHPLTNRPTHTYRLLLVLRVAERPRQRSRHRLADRRAGLLFGKLAAAYMAGDVQSLRDTDRQTHPPTTWQILALLSENGPCFVNADGTDTTINPYSWTTRANVLWIDQPAGSPRVFVCMCVMDGPARLHQHYLTLATLPMNTIQPPQAWASPTRARRTAW